MSRATAYAVYPKERIEEIAEYRNSWGLASALWGQLAERHLTMPYWKIISGIDGGAAPLWALVNDPTVPLYARALLGWTFDAVYVEHQHFARLAADIRLFLANYPIPGESVNHWPVVADLLESNPDVPGIGFQWTSVSENPFTEWNEETETSRVAWERTRSLYVVLDAQEERRRVDDKDRCGAKLDQWVPA